MNITLKFLMEQFIFSQTDNGSEDFDRETGYYHVPVNFYLEV